MKKFQLKTWMPLICCLICALAVSFVFVSSAWFRDSDEGTATITMGDPVVIELTGTGENGAIQGFAQVYGAGEEVLPGDKILDEVSITVPQDISTAVLRVKYATTILSDSTTVKTTPLTAKEIELKGFIDASLSAQTINNIKWAKSTAGEQWLYYEDLIGGIETEQVVGLTNSYIFPLNIEDEAFQGIWFKIEMYAQAIQASHFDKIEDWHYEVQNIHGQCLLKNITDYQLSRNETIGDVEMIYYNATGGVVARSSEVISETTTTYENLPTPTRTGYTFNGWKSHPTGYSVLDYISANGTQYVNTGFIPDGNTSILMELEYNSTSSMSPFGARTQASSSDTTSLTLFSLGETYRSDYYGAYVSTGTVTANQFTHIYKNKEKFIVNGARLSSNIAVPSGQSNQPLYLFSVNTGGSSLYRVSGKLYGAKIYDGDTLVRDFIPVSNNESVGLYDLVNGLFYPSVGDNPFTAGNIIVDSSADENIVITDTLVSTTSHTLYASWTKNNYTVTYDANGGTGNVAPSTHTYGDSSALNTNSFMRTGYTFSGYNALADGSGITYSDGQNVLNLTANASITLYAMWTANQYAVTFDANGGTEPSPLSKIVTYGSSYGDLATTTRNNANFNGWFTSASGGTMVTSSTIVEITSATTLYAQWTILGFVVTFDANGGSTPSPSTITYEPSSTYGTLPTTTRSGATFTGWFTEEVGGTQITSSTVVNSVYTTLYAQWSYTVTFDANGGSTPSPSFKKVYDSLTYGTLPTTSRSGFQFLYWTRDKVSLGQTPTNTSGISTKEMGVITYCVARGFASDIVDFIIELMFKFDFTSSEIDDAFMPALENIVSKLSLNGYQPCYYQPGWVVPSSINKAVINEIEISLKSIFAFMDYTFKYVGGSSTLDRSQRTYTVSDATSSISGNWTPYSFFGVVVEPVYAKTTTFSGNHTLLAVWEEV